MKKCDMNLRNVKTKTLKQELERRKMTRNAAKGLMAACVACYLILRRNNNG